VVHHTEMQTVPVTEGHNPNVPIIQGRQDYREGAYVQGEGDGQSDDILQCLLTENTSSMQRQ
jgi:hypothetical protein